MRFHGALMEVYALSKGSHGAFMVLLWRCMRFPGGFMGLSWRCGCAVIVLSWTSKVLPRCFHGFKVLSWTFMLFVMGVLSWRCMRYHAVLMGVL